MSYSARILADSVSPFGVRLTTMEVTFPRIVLAEFNTHRMLSRNSASSRAVPVAKQIARVKDDPFVPEQFLSNIPGMQGGAPLEGLAAQDARQTWIYASRDAVMRADMLHRRGIHKAIVNRLLEPFLWHTVIVSATEWSNFFALRCHPDAQPEIRNVALLMRDLYTGHEPTPVGYGAWHLPLVEVWEKRIYATSVVKALATARCARVSYLTHDGRFASAADLRLHDRLASSRHWSPFEHVARPAIPASAGHGPENRFYGNFCGWFQYRKEFVGEADAGATL